MQIRVFKPKKKTTGDLARLGEDDLVIVGQVRQVVFSPNGLRVVGLLARRPDVAGMIKRPDAFIALDSVIASDAWLVVTDDKAGMDESAIERLQLDWEHCIMWTGMDAKTTDGKELGWVDDVEFNGKTGAVKAFYVGDGSVAKSLVGNVVIPGDMLVGYKDGFMLVKPEAAGLSLNGGLAAKAGTEYGRAKYNGKQAVAKAGKAASSMAEKGARGLGRMIGKAKKSAKNTAKNANPKTMFGSFVDEFKKASK